MELNEFVSHQDLQKINVKLDELQKIIKNHKPINYLNIIAELENQLLRLKEIFKINRFRIKTLNELLGLANQYYGTFELIKILVFSKAIKIMRQNTDISENEKISIFMKIINESIDYSIDLIKNLKKYG